MQTGVVRQLAIVSLLVGVRHGKLPHDRQLYHLNRIVAKHSIKNIRFRHSHEVPNLPASVSLPGIRLIDATRKPNRFDAWSLAATLSNPQVFGHVALR